MRSLFAIAVLVLACPYARATITFNVLAADLQTASGGLMSINGQVLLVASTTGGFGDPTAGSPLSVGSFLSGDDVILFRGNLDSGSGNGWFERTVNFELSSFSGLDPGDVVRLYWFPTLSASSTSAGEGDGTYGFYWDPNTTPPPPQNGSAPWVIPSDGLPPVALTFATDSQGGAYLDTVGRANFTVAPVPEASNFITAGLALGLCALGVVRRARQK